MSNEGDESTASRGNTSIVNSILFTTATGFIVRDKKRKYFKCDNRNDSKEQLPVPSDRVDLTRLYTEGPNPLRNILPRRIVQTLENGCAYVPIRNILQFHLANGQPIEPLVDLRFSESVPSIHGSSPRGKALLSFSLNSDRTGSNTVQSL